MRTIRLLYLVILLFTGFPFHTYSQKKNPPGTIFLRHNLYIDETPACNFDYNVYADFLRRYTHFNLDSFEAYTKTLPFYNFDIAPFIKYANFTYDADSLKYLVTDTAKSFRNGWMAYTSYLRERRFFYYPVVNISPQAAENYCRWRTSMVKMLYAATPREKDRKKLYNDFVYRLPTSEELAYAVKKFHGSRKFGFQDASPGDSLPNFNFRSKESATTFFKITGVNEISRSSNGWNEVSWNTKDYSFLPGRRLGNKEADDNVTFRCVCEIK